MNLSSKLNLNNHLKYVINQNLKNSNNHSPIYSKKDILNLILPNHSNENITTNLPDNQQSFVFRNWVDYIFLCFRNHYQPIIKPSDIYYVILGVVSDYINQHPERFKRIFIDYHQQVNANIDTTNLKEPNDKIQQIFDKIYKLSCINIKHIFLDFSTDSDESISARKCIFCKMVTPFFKIQTFNCGFPSLSLLGTIEDWQKIISNIEMMKLLFGVVDFETQYLKKYFNKVEIIIKKLLDQVKNRKIDISFFKEMIKKNDKSNKVGGGVEGWICDLYNTEQHTPVSFFPPHISLINYSFTGPYHDKPYVYFSYFLGSGKLIDENRLAATYNYILKENTKKKNYKLSLNNI